MKQEFQKLRWALVGIAILLWIVLMFGPGQTINEINACSLYTNAPTKARDLYEAYKALLNGW